MARKAAEKGASIVALFGGAPPAGTPKAANSNRFATGTKTVTVRRKLEKSGVVIKVKVPVREFHGVSICTRITEEGVLFSAIELVHSDPALTYKVYEEQGNRDVVAEWQNWGAKLRLPLYIKTGDGELLPYSQDVGGVAIGTGYDRRKMAHEAGRRPRFLNRRTPGMRA